MKGSGFKGARLPGAKVKGRLDPLYPIYRLFEG
jgi:hypothetical protein